MNNQILQPKDQCIDKALDSLIHCSMFNLNRFIRQFNLPNPHLQPLQIDTIQKAVLLGEKRKNAQFAYDGKYSFPDGNLLIMLEENERLPDLDDLLLFLDNWRMNGYQHIFLFRLRKGKNIYLKELNNPVYIGQRLTDLKLGITLMGNLTFWYAVQPRLSHVGYLEEKNSKSLFFKWVETREWSADNIISKERSVNYFTIDLTNGDAEIRIQHLRPNSLKTLREEYEIYKKEINAIIDFDAFVPVLLEPAIRKLMLVRKVDGVTVSTNLWQIELPNGGLLQGIRDPSLIMQIQLIFKRFMAKKIHCNWHFPPLQNGPRVILTHMKSESNSIRLTRACEADQLKKILKNIYQISETEITNKELRDFSNQRPLHEPLSRLLDLQMDRLGRDRFISKILENQNWISGGQAKEIFRELINKYPKIFIQEKNGQELVFIGSWHSGLRRRIEQKKGLFRPFLELLEENLGRKKYRKMVFAVVVILFFLLAILMSGLFLILLKIAGSGKIFIKLLFFLYIILVIALADYIIGTKNYTRAVRIFKNLVKIQKRKFILIFVLVIMILLIIYDLIVGDFLLGKLLNVFLQWLISLTR
jgi:hypothetical protein